MHVQSLHFQAVASCRAGAVKAYLIRGFVGGSLDITRWMPRQGKTMLGQVERVSWKFYLRGTRYLRSMRPTARSMGSVRTLLACAAEGIASGVIGFLETTESGMTKTLATLGAGKDFSSR